MTIGVVRFRTGDDADIQADMNMAKILFRVHPILLKYQSHKFILCQVVCSLPVPLIHRNEN